MFGTDAVGRGELYREIDTDVGVGLAKTKSKW